MAVMLNLLEQSDLLNILLIVRMWFRVLLEESNQYFQFLKVKMNNMRNL